MNGVHIGLVAPALLLGVLTGCLHAPPDGPEDDAAGPEGDAFGTLPGDTFVWDRCQTWITDRFWVPGTNPGPTPDGWEKPHIRRTSTTQLEGWACERVHWGPFERPLHVVVETYANHTTPPSCGQPDGLGGSILAALWVDDAEVVAFLRQRYAMPAHLVSVRVTPGFGDGDVARQTWHWGPPGHEPSRLTLTAVLGPSDAERQARWFWFSDSTVSVVDFTQQPSISFGLDMVPATGNLLPPTLMARDGDPYAGRGEWGDGTGARGTIQSYEDLLCETPRS